VLPAVPSTTIPPSDINFFSWASFINAKAALSLTDPPGFKYSALPYMLHPVISDAAFHFIRGVFPMDSIKLFLICVIDFYLYQKLHKAGIPL
jgi:hypothetical protein